MTSTTTTNAANSQVIYLPTVTNYGGVLNNSAVNTWTTSQYTYVVDENGMKIIEQINKIHEFMTRYKSLINGVIFKELTKKIADLLCSVSCIWGIGLQGNLFPNVGTWSPIYPTWSYTTTQTIPTYTLGTTSVGNTWVQFDTTSDTTGVSYTY